MHTFMAAISSSLFLLGATLATAQPQALLPRANAPLSEQEWREYERIIGKEQQGRSKEQFIENAVGGLAAMTVGIYGYYNDERGALVKLAYGAAQTSGVVMLCKSIIEYDNPSFILDLNDSMRSSASLDSAEVRRQIIVVERKKEQALTRTVAVSSSILGTLYLYNAYRTEQDDTELRNVFYFLSFNLYVAAVGSWYKILQPGRDEASQSGLSLDFAPLPTLTYTF